MRNQHSAIILGLAGAASLLGAQRAQADGMNQLHPGFEVTDIQPTSRKLYVGGLDFFSDGRLAACTWGNPGDVWIMKDPHAATAATAQVQRFAFGLQQVMGCKVVRDTLYVMQMGELTQLVDTDGDGRADRYNKMNDAFSTSESLLAYAFDVTHFGGAFYATLSADVSFGGWTFKPALKDRSVFIRMGRDNSLEYLSGGFRNPNGMGLGFGNRIFGTENQGAWMPSSKINWLEKGKFYGHKNDPPGRFDNLPMTQPLAWLPHGDVSLTPGNVMFIPQGLYAGQLLLAEQDRRISRIYRVSVEEVGGVMQGAVIPFSGGIGTGVSRLALGKDNVIYAGLLGADGGWSGVSSVTPGLKRFRPKDVNKAHVFEMLAVRSTGPATIEVEFTRPVGTAASDPARYKVQTWTFQPQEGYGAGNKVDNHALTVQGATVRPDGRTVELRIAGLQEKYLVHIRLDALLSSDGEAPWTPQAWLTLNKFGPGKVPQTAGCMDPKYAEYDPKAVINDPNACGTVPVRRAMGPASPDLRVLVSGGTTVVAWDRAGPWALQVVDASGRIRDSRVGEGPLRWELDAARVPRGLNWLVLRSGGRMHARSFVH